jgi:hypothetical protein
MVRACMLFDIPGRSASYVQRILVTVIQLQGYNFGETSTFAGNVVVEIGGESCTAVTISGSSALVWQITSTGVPYLWCTTPVRSR